MQMVRSVQVTGKPGKDVLDDFRSTGYKQPTITEIVDLIPLYAPDPAVQHKLLVANPARLFRFN